MPFIFNVNMPPRKTRVSKKKAEKEVVEPVVEETPEVTAENQSTEAAPVPTEKQVEKPSKGKGKAASTITESSIGEETKDGEEDVSAETNEVAKGGKVSQEERLAKLKELRMRMVCGFSC